MNDINKQHIEKTSIFDFIDCTSKSYKINKPIRLIELFAGIGSQAKALKNIGANFEHYKVVEFDKYAIASYNAIHGTNFITSDITQIKGTDLEISETDKYCYVMTYSFPCQDLSLAGKQKGMSKGSSTRSGLLWEVERLLNEIKELPQILLMENVPQVHSKKNILDFDKWIKFLQEKGYSNYWKDLNAKDFGTPQNRNRTFMVSILGSYEYEFSKPFELKLRLKDMLEKNVDEKYYLSDKMIQYITANNKKWTDNVCVEDKSLFTETQAKMITPEGNVRRYINSETVDEFNEGQCADISFPNGYNKAQRVHNECPAINTTTTSTSFITKINQTPLRIRKLTPKECWRLMGFDDEDYEKAAKVNSNSQLYKQAGNSIVVNVLEEIFKELL